jgi:hypothetical protein
MYSPQEMLGNSRMEQGLPRRKAKAVPCDLISILIIILAC